MNTPRAFVLLTLAASTVVIAQPGGQGGYSGDQAPAPAPAPLPAPVAPPAGPTSSQAKDWTRGGGVLPAISRQAVPAERMANQSALTDETIKLSPLEQLFQQHVSTLSNPFFEGRAPGTRGIELAAEYLEFWMRGIGLEPAYVTPAAGTSDGAVDAAPAGRADSYRQYFPAGREVVVTDARMSLNGEALKAGVDFNVLGTSGTGDVTGSVFSVGYGIEEGPDDYSSFAGMAEGATLEGKIALVFRFEPMDEKGKSKWSGAGGGRGGGAWTNASALRPKLAAIARRKPAAIVLVNPPGADDPRVSRLEDARSTRQGGALDLPIVMVTIAQGEEIAKRAGTTLMALRQSADEKGGITELPGVTLGVAAKLESKVTPAYNVAGVLRGKGDLADQYLVIGGHYDHLGYGYFGSRAGQRAAGLIHPGADDNASGTAGVLIAAQMLAEQYNAMPEGSRARSIIFIGFSAEESGLIGARHFVRNLPVKKESITAMLNMDMIGRVRSGKLDITGTGSAEGLEDLIKPMVDASGLAVRMLPGGSGPSDHAAFYAADIPVLAFFSGVHSVYHMPEDHWWTINTPGAMKVVNMVTQIATAMATRPEPLKFKEATGQSVDLQDPSEPRRESAAPGQPRMGPVRVRFGISPENYDDGQPGVPVGEVFPGTSAADAGIKAGDRLTKWNGAEVKDVEGWMTFLQQANPGDVVDVEVVREGTPQVIKVTLKAREQGDR
jgi:hypothetical protein